MTAPLLSVVVYGEPQTAGNKTAYPRQGRDGRLHVAMVDGRRPEARARGRDWRHDVVMAVCAQMSGREPFDFPLEASLTFTVRRPGNLPARRRAGGVLVPVRHYPGQRPDLVKMTRAVEDAVTAGGGWRDDARVVLYRRLGKFYAGDALYGEPDVLATPGIVLRVWAADCRLSAAPGTVMDMGDPEGVTRDMRGAAQ